MGVGDGTRVGVGGGVAVGVGSDVAVGVAIGALQADAVNTTMAISARRERAFMNRGQILAPKTTPLPGNEVEGEAYHADARDLSELFNWFILTN